MDTVQLYTNAAEIHESGKSEVDIGEASVEAHNEGSTFVIELPRELKYDCGSPDCVSTPCGVDVDFASDSADPSAGLVPHVQEVPEMGPSDNDAQFQEMCLSEQKKQGTECDWESLISDAADILIFNPPNSSEAFKGLVQNSQEPVTRFCNSFVSEFSQIEINNEHEMQIVDSVSSEQHNGDEPFSQTGDASHLEDLEQMQDRFVYINSNTGMASNQCEREDKEVETRVAFSCKVKLATEFHCRLLLHLFHYCRDEQFFRLWDKLVKYV